MSQLIILNDPAQITGGTVHELNPHVTLHENLVRLVEAGGADCELHINGQQVDPLKDPRLNMLPGADDRVVLVCRPKGVETWLLVVSLALSVYSYVTLRNPQAPAVGKDSPNNSLTGQSNTARTYQAIPDVYGCRRVWPDLIQNSSIEYVDNVKRVTEWLCISRGIGTISEVRFADTLMTEIRGASYLAFQPAATPDAYPERNSTTLTDVYETFASPEVNGQEMGSLAFPELIERMGTLGDDGSGHLTLTFTDEAAWANLKSLAPTGTARVEFTYAVFFEGPGAVSFSQETTVLGYNVASGLVTFTFSASPRVDAVPLTQTVMIGIRAGSTATTAIGPFTLPTTCDRIRWNTVFLRGLKGTVQVKAEWWQIDSGGAEVSGSRQNQTFTYTEDTYDQRYYTNQVTPSAGSGRYRVTFARLTSDLGNGADVAKLENLYAVRYYATKVLPGVTVMRVTTNATTEATGIRDRKFNLKWTRHVRTLTSDTISESRNFARAMAHIWTLAGESTAGLDMAALEAINAEIGETSPLLRFDGSLDDADMSLGERLQLVANHARCTVWRDGQKWTVTRDQERALVQMQLDYRNLASGADSVTNYSAHLPASFDGVELEYVEEATQSKKAYVRFQIGTGAPVAGTPLNPRKIRLSGCATLAQAENRARLEARKLLFQRTSITDTALGDAQSLGPGSLVRWVDPSDFAGDDGLQAGEVLTVVGSTITTSEALDFKGQPSGRIVFTGTDGLLLGAPVQCTPNPDGSVNLITVPAGLYVRDGVTRQLGSRYAFGVGLTEAEMEAAGLYVVADCKPVGNGRFDIALANYDARIYADD